MEYEGTLVNNEINKVRKLTTTIRALEGQLSALQAEYSKLQEKYEADTSRLRSELYEKGIFRKAGRPKKTAKPARKKVANV